ncbi:AP-1 adaptor complex sigma subunit Aps1 [Plenodomus biglobosus]|nr:AP-1 adaptor complex sigma subunit Aps1 [Plenodomus biglobosus]
MVGHWWAHAHGLRGATGNTTGPVAGRIVLHILHTYTAHLTPTPTPTAPPPQSTMTIKYLILLSRQGKVRLAKWFTTLAPKDKAKIVKDVSQLVLARRTRMCNFLEYKDTKIVYRRYASLFFIAGCDSTDNELITLEIVHRYVEQMDKYYGNVCELDIIFNFQKAYFILDELLLAGEMQESSKKNVLRCIGQQDSLEDMEAEDDIITKIM